MVTRATVQNGRVELPHRLELPDGTPVLIVAADDGSNAPRQDIGTTIANLRRLAVPISLPDEAFSSEFIYES